MRQKTQSDYDLIPLAMAAEEANFTPEYLNFLSRSGKLKAEKIGRNWLTTRRWLQEFIMGNSNDVSGVAADDVEKSATKKPYCDVLAVKIARMEKELEELRREKEQAKKKAELSGRKCPVMYVIAMIGFSVASIFVSHFICMHEVSIRSLSPSDRLEKAVGSQEVGQESLFLAENFR